MSKIYKINGKEYQVTVNSVIGNNADVIVNGIEYHVEIYQQSDMKSSPLGMPASMETVSCNANKPVSINKVTAPLPGVILDVKVKVGDLINVGDSVAVLEAMKMENDILSEFAGIVTSVDVKTGDSVLDGAVIVKIS